MTIEDEITAGQALDLLSSASKDNRLTRGDLAAFAFILDRVGTSGGECISAGEIAQHCGVSVRLVRYATLTLERLGYVSVQSSPGKENRYSIMNSKRAQQMEDQLSGVARKILDATPQNDAWPALVILREIKRATGSNYEIKLINHHLQAMKDQGLVREPRHGQWIRAPIKECSVERKTATPAETSRGLLGQEASPREALKLLSIGLLNIASQIEEVANEIDRAEKRNEEKTAKLRQLQELLRGLGQ